MGPPARRSVVLAVVAVVAVALGTRVGAAIWWQARLPAGTEFAFGDSYSYWYLARAIARGEPYEYAQSTVFRAPGYPLLLAPLFLWRDEPPVLAARLLGAALGAATVGCVALWTWQLFDGPTAVLAASGAALYPGAIGMSVFVLSEAPFCLLMLLQLSCWVAADRAVRARRRWWWAAVGGLLAGLATLVRPSWLLFMPFAGVLAVMLMPRRRQHAAIAAVMAAVMLLVMVPWWWRNYRATGTFVLTTLETGASLYDGWNPQADGSSDMRFMDSFRARLAVRDAAAASSEPADVRLDRALRDASLEWARSHPGRVLQLMGIKIVRMWSPWPHAEEFQSWYMRWTVFASYVPLMICGLWGAWRYARRDWGYVLCLVPAVYFTLLHMVFVSSIRYREPALLPWMALAAAVVGHWWVGTLPRQVPPSSTAAAAG